MLTTIASLAILALASLPSASAAKCSVIGWQYDNSIFDPQGAPTIATSQGLHFYRDGKLIHEWVPCNKCSSICVDSKNVEVPGLKTTVGWAANCNVNTFK